MTDWSRKFDEKERRLDESDEPEKEKIEVVTETEEKPEPVWSGLYCSRCRDFATFIFNGDSLCYDHYQQEMDNIIKEHKRSNK